MCHTPGLTMKTRRNFLGKDRGGNVWSQSRKYVTFAECWCEWMTCTERGFLFESEWKPQVWWTGVRNGVNIESARDAGINAVVFLPHSSNIFVSAFVEQDLFSWNFVQPNFITQIPVVLKLLSLKVILVKVLQVKCCKSLFSIQYKDKLCLHRIVLSWLLTNC